MTPDEIGAWAQLAGAVGGNGLLFLGIIGLLKGWVVTDRHIRDIVEAKDAQIAYLISRLNATRTELRGFQNNGD